MSGNCAIGIAASASSPASVMTKEMTRASRGRRMKSEEIMPLSRSFGRNRRHHLRRHRHSGTHSLLALNDDEIARRNPLLDDHEALAHGSQAHATQLDPIV